MGTMTMNTHPHGEQLSAYIDDMLDVAQMRSVAGHLRACTACRSACASLQQTCDLLRGLDAPAKPSPEFWTDTYRRMRVEGHARRPMPPLGEQIRQGLLGTQRRWAAGVAAAAVLGAAILAPLVSNDLHPTQTTPPPAVSMNVDVVDFSSLVRDHAQSAAAQPLADSDRQTMLSADADALGASVDAGAEAAGNGSFTTDAAP